jgi:hypothetical protein
MGTRSSKISPSPQPIADYSTVFETLGNTMRTIHNLYFTILHDGVLNPESFGKYLELTESMNRQRYAIKRLLKKETVPQILFKHQLSEIKTEQMNATMAFKASLCKQLLAKKFIIDDRLLLDSNFKAFFSLLPDLSRQDSYNRFAYSEKQKTDTDILEQLLTANLPKPQKVYKNKYDSCPHCGKHLTRESVLYPSQSLHPSASSSIIYMPSRVSSRNSSFNDELPVTPHMVAQLRRSK